MCSLVILNLHWILLIDTLLPVHWPALNTYCTPLKRRYNSLVEGTESFMMGFMKLSWYFTHFYYQSFLYFSFRMNKGGYVKCANCHPSLAFRGRKRWLEAPRGKVRYFLVHFAIPSSWPHASPQRAWSESPGGGGRRGEVSSGSTEPQRPLRPSPNLERGCFLGAFLT